MRRVLLTLLGCTAIAGSIYAQGFTSMDAVAFCRGSDSVQVEVYFSVLQKLLPFTHKDSTWVAPINGTIEIYQDKKIVSTSVIHKAKTVIGTEDEFKQHIADDVIDGAFFMVLPKVNTMAVLILTGLNDTKSLFNDTIRRAVSIPIRKPQRYQFANIEYASSMQQTSDKSNFFEKAGFIVIPNPSYTFGGNFTKLYAYSELNVPSSEAKSDNSGTVRISVIDATGREMYNTNEKVLLNAPIVPIIASAEIDGLPTDSYLFRLTLSVGGVVMDSVTKPFFYDSGIQLTEEESTPNAATVDEATLFQRSDISSLGELELNERSAQTLYGAIQKQHEVYDKLTDLNQKRHWLFAYWRAKDAESQVAPMVSYREFMKRVDEANRQFTVMKTPGWKTSRGRVWIQYGRPDQITGEPFATNSKPYVQWDYLNQRIPLQSGSRAEFVFVDKYGGGNFILVSSNARGEVEEDDWFTREAMRTVGY